MNITDLRHKKIHSIMVEGYVTEAGFVPLPHDSGFHDDPDLFEYKEHIDFMLILDDTTVFVQHTVVEGQMFPQSSLYKVQFFY